MNTASSRMTARMTVSEILNESAALERDRRIAEAKEYISRASVHLRGIGPDYERIAWMLDDTIELFDAANLDSDVDYAGDFSVLTREFVPVARLSSNQPLDDELSSAAAETGTGGARSKNRKSSEKKPR